MLLAVCRPVCALGAIDGDGKGTVLCGAPGPVHTAGLGCLGCLGCLRCLGCLGWAAWAGLAGLGWAGWAGLAGLGRPGAEGIRSGGGKKVSSGGSPPRAFYNNSQTAAIQQTAEQQHTANSKQLLPLDTAYCHWMQHTENQFFSAWWPHKGAGGYIYIVCLQYIYIHVVGR